MCASLSVRPGRPEQPKADKEKALGSLPWSGARAVLWRSSRAGVEAVERGRTQSSGSYYHGPACRRCSVERVCFPCPAPLRPVSGPKAKREFEQSIPAQFPFFSSGLLCSPSQTNSLLFVLKVSACRLDPDFGSLPYGAFVGFVQSRKETTGGDSRSCSCLL